METIAFVVFIGLLLFMLGVLVAFGLWQVYMMTYRTEDYLRLAEADKDRRQACLRMLERSQEHAFHRRRERRKAAGSAAKFGISLAHKWLIR